MNRLSLVFAFLFFAACASPRAWVYAPEARQSRASVVNASVVVPPFLDKRSTDSSDALLMYLIPLMPYGFQDLPVPEAASHHAASGQWQFKPADDIARAVAQEIDASRIFREAFTDARASVGDYVLTGEVQSTQFDGKMLSYCLSVYGPALWLIGLPATHTKNTLELNLNLKAKGSDKVVWEYQVRASDSETGWIYSLGTDFMYNRMLKKAMPGVLASLEAAMGAVPGQ